jgi:hypothetical protein
VSLFAKRLDPIPGEVMSEFSLRGLFRSFLLLKQPKLLLMLSTVLTRASGLAFFIAKLPVLLPSLSIVPYVIVSWAISLLLVQTLLLVTFSMVPAWLWSAAHSTVEIAAMILVSISDVVDPTQRLYLLYVVSGLLGAGESLGLALLNVFVSNLFPEDPSSVFSVVRGFEAYWVGSYILICGFCIVWVPIGLLVAVALSSFCCIAVLSLMLKREVAAKLPPASDADGTSKRSG